MAFKAFKARKLQTLTENETISSVNSWQQNMEFHLPSCNEFSLFLDPKFTWGSKSTPNRGLTSDVTGENQRSAAAKCIILNHMIGLIVSYCPETIRLEIDRKATSLKWIWQRIRRHYGFSKSESHFLKLGNITLNDGERHESFYQRIMSHLYDNLLTTDSGILFDGEPISTNEEMSPTVERLAVYLWLQLIDTRLPAYVSRVYSHDLLSKSIKDIQPEICQNMDSLLMEISAQEDIKIAYARGRSNLRLSSSNANSVQKTQNTCAFCKACNKPYTGHDISSCWSLSKSDRNELANALHENMDSEGDQAHIIDVKNVSVKSPYLSPPSIPAFSRVLCMSSPHFYCYHRNTPCKVTLDSGAESNIVSLNFVKLNNIKMASASQHARQLDKSRVKICGEIDINLSFGSALLKLSALVVESMDSDILAGVPFCMTNNIEFSFSKQEIYIQGNPIQYGAYPSSHVKRVNTVLCNSPTPGLNPEDSQEADLPVIDRYKHEMTITARPDFTTVNPEIDSVIFPDYSVEPLTVAQSANVREIHQSEPAVSSSHDIPCRKLVAGIMYQKKRKILVVRDILTSYTTATFVNDVSANELKNGLLLCCLPLQISQSTVYVNHTSRLQELTKFKSLVKCDCTLHIRQAESKENLTFEQACKELKLELKKVDPSESPVSAINLLSAIHNINLLIRSNGLSAKTMLSNHILSKCNENCTGLVPPYSTHLGSFVFLKNAVSQFTPCQPFMIMDIKQDDFILQKVLPSGLLSSKLYCIPKSKVHATKSSKRKEKVTARCDYSSDDIDSCKMIDTANNGLAPKEWHIPVVSGNVACSGLHWPNNNNYLSDLYV